MDVPISGAPYTLRSGAYEAEIAGVGATLRALRHEGTDLVVPFALDELRPAMRGALLAPWPNRIAGGEYEFGGARYALAQNEPERRNAAHGLIAWMEFRPVVRSVDRLVLRVEIVPQPGYPWRLRVDAVFQLHAGGLSQEIVATNVGEGAAPVGLGGHPVLAGGRPRPGGIDQLLLTVPAEEVLLACADRLLPVQAVSVVEGAGSAWDFRQPRRLGRVEINNAFTRLARDADGISRVRLVDSDGLGAEIEWDERCPWVQLYTSDDGAGDEDRNGLAVEPMTCPPDAFNSGRDLIVVEPGESVSAGWTIRRIAARRGQPLGSPR